MTLRHLCYFLFASSVLASQTGDLREVTKQSTGIYLGEVTSATSYYGADGEIYTDVAFQVRGIVKGQTASVETFTVKGGKVGETEVLFTDVPAFHEGETALVFWEDQPVHKYEIVNGKVADLNLTARKLLAQVEAILREDGLELAPGEKGRISEALDTIEAKNTTGETTESSASCFALIGPKWTTGSATYAIGAGLPSDWTSAIQAGASAWSQAGTPFRFNLDSASQNTVTQGPLTGSTLASTRIEYSGTSIRRFTVTFNSSRSWSTTGEAGKFDVQGITAHELGHALGLNHPSGSICSEQTMWSSAGSGETKKRTLEDGDRAGTAKLYTATSTPTPAPTPTPTPTPTPSAPTVIRMSLYPSNPAANQTFYFLVFGTGFNTSNVEAVITGPGCPAAGCVVAPYFKTATQVIGVTRLITAGSYSVKVRNGATGVQSSSLPLTIR